MKTILITGGLGFVGSHLADRLIEDGCKVVIVDNLTTNVASPEDYNQRCEVIVGSVEAVAERLGAYRFDEIFHLASFVGPAGVLQHAGDIAQSTILTADIATKLALAQGARLIIASTSEVYGQTGSLHEDINCIVPAKYTVRLEYAAAKLTSEIAALNKARVSNLWVNIVRPFNIAGPRQLPDGGFVLPRFVVAALTGAPLTVFGDGSQIRAFTDVRDIVSGLIAMITGPKSNLVLNLGNPANEIGILKLAQMVVKLADSRSEIQLVNPKELFGELYEEGTERVPLVEKALACLTWRPQYSLEQTILDTLAYYQSRPNLLQAPLVEAVASRA